MSKEAKREQAVKDIVNQMFIIAGHKLTYDDILGKEDWYLQHTMTVEQGEELKQWGIAYLRKNLKMSQRLAEREMNWFNVQWGLTYSNWEDNK